MQPRISSIPSMGSIPPSVRGHRQAQVATRIGIGRMGRGVPRRQSLEQNSWDGEVQHHIFTPPRNKRKVTARQPFAQFPEGPAVRHILEELEEQIAELEGFKAEGLPIRADREIARLLKRKERLERSL